MRLIFALAAFVMAPMLSFASVDRGIALQIYVLQPNSEPVNAVQLPVRAKILSPNNCVLVDELHPSADIVNGYMRIAIGTGNRQAGDHGLSLAQALGTGSTQTGLDVVDGASGACDYTPSSQDIRKLRVTFQVGSDNLSADFTVRSSGYAVIADEANSLGGKSASDFVHINSSKQVTQSKLEEFFNAITSQVGSLIKYDGTNFVAVDPSSIQGSGGPTDWADITNKPETFAPSGHLHPVSQITGLGALATKDLVSNSDISNLDYSKLSNVPASFAPSTHSHAISDVTGLQSALNGKANVSHQHSADDITSGILPLSRGGLGASLSGANQLLVTNSTGSAVATQACATGKLLSFDALGVTCVDQYSLPDVATSGIYSKVSVDSKGRVTSGATLVASEVPVTAISGVSGTQVQTALESLKTQIDAAANTNSTSFLKKDGTIPLDTDVWLQGATASSGNLNIMRVRSDGAAQLGDANAKELDMYAKVISLNGTTVDSDASVSGRIDMSTGNNSGSAGTGFIKLKTGDVLNGNSGKTGDISLVTGTPGTGARGKVLVDASSLDVNNTKIINVATPSLPADAVNKSYTDAAVAAKANISHTHSAADITSGTLAVAQGGTGQSSFANGEILIGSSGSLAKSTLTAGPGITITNGAGNITIAANGSGSVTNVSATAPLQVVNGTSTPVVSIANGSAAGQVLRYDGTSSWVKAKLSYTDLVNASSLSPFPTTTCGSGQALIYSSVSDSFACTTLSIAASQITGTLSVAQGGTNNAALAMTSGGVLYTDGSKIVNLGAGVAGQILKSNGSGAPAWTDFGTPVNGVSLSYAASNSQSLTTAAILTMFGQKLHDNTTGAYNTATGVFTAPSAAKYRSSIQVFTTNATSVPNNISIRKNGGVQTVRLQPQFISGSQYVWGGSVTYDLAKGDTIDFFASASSTGSVYNSAIDSFFSIESTAGTLIPTGTVTTGSNNNIRQIALTIVNTGGVPTDGGQIGAAVASITDAGIGNYVINFVPGTFTQKPFCNWTCDSGFTEPRIVNSATSINSVQVTCDGVDGSNRVDAGGVLTCTGVH